jgi:hypothetical protein
LFTLNRSQHDEEVEEVEGEEGKNIGDGGKIDAFRK